MQEQALAQAAVYVAARLFVQYAEQAWAAAADEAVANSHNVQWLLHVMDMAALALSAAEQLYDEQLYDDYRQEEVEDMPL